MNSYVLVIILIFGIAMVLILISRQIIKKRKEEEQDWKVVKKGRDAIIYKQKITGEWQSIEIDAELLIGKINHVIYFKTKDEWSAYPKWAQNRSEIISRIKKVFPSSKTEYENV